MIIIDPLLLEELHAVVAQIYSSIYDNVLTHVIVVYRVK